MAECEVGPGNVGLSFVFPERDCQHNIHIDLRYGLYKDTHERHWQTLIEGEAGFLERLHGESDIQLGPVLAIGGSGQSLDWKQELDQLYISPRLRLRYWMLDEWMTLEAAAGPSIRFDQDHLGSWIRRPGGYVEIGPTIHGLAGVYLGTGYTPGGGGLPADFRTTVGFRMNLSMSAAAAIMSGVVYGCAKARC
jgi:hypothetical protein